jgi:hypothetical protein
MLPNHSFKLVGSYQILKNIRQGVAVFLIVLFLIFVSNVSITHTVRPSTAQQATDITKKKELSLQKRPSYKAKKAYKWLHKGAVQQDDTGKPINTNRSRLSIAGSGAGMTAYQLIDSLIAQDEAVRIADSIDKKTPHEIMQGFTHQSEVNQLGGFASPSKIARAIRPLSKIGWGTSSFAHELTKIPAIEKEWGKWRNDVFPKQHPVTKVLGSANLAGLAADTVHSLIHRKNDSLSAKEATLLSYLNRREGVPSDITNYKNFIQWSTRARQLINILGQGAIPFLIASLAKNNRTAAAYVANSAGIADSIISMIERQKKRNLMKKIKEIAPLIQKELAANPPTEQERNQNKQQALSLDLDLLEDSTTN